MEKDAIEIIYELLPGFLACWVFYGLTAHPKPSQFERIIQALIFSLFVKVFVALIKSACISFGDHAFNIGPWTANGEKAISLLTALVIGLLLARWSNNNTMHGWLSCWKGYDRLRARLKWLPQWQWTKKTSMPSEWYSAFHRFELEVVLHLAGDKPRRLHGYPDEWSDSPEKGHIVLYNPSWLLDNGKIARLYTVERIMVPVKDVEMVEFLKRKSEIGVDEATLTGVQSTLIGINKRSAIDGSKDTPSTVPSEREPESNTESGGGTEGDEPASTG